jgi:hypothetical protein
LALFVYAPVIKTGTRELIEALGAKRLVRFDGLNFVHKGTPLKFDEKNDTIICWGACVPPLGKLRIFNNNLRFSSHEQMHAAIAHIPCATPAWRFCATFPYTGKSIDGEPYVQDRHYGSVMPFNGSPTKGQTVVPSKQEYRLTIFDDEVIKTEKKYPLLKVHNQNFGPYVQGEMSHRFIRSKECGWEWRTCKEKLENIPKALKEIKAQLGFDFFIASILTPSNDCINANSYSYLRRIDLVPELDADGVQVFLNLIQKWIKNNGGSIVP